MPDNELDALREHRFPQGQVAAMRDAAWMMDEPVDELVVAATEDDAADADVRRADPPPPAHAIAAAVRGLPGASIVAIDGAGGSGKTTVAAAVAALLDGATIVHGDDFYRAMPEPERERLSAEEGYWRYFDWERLRDEVLAPLHAGRPARYRSYDWETGDLGAWHELAAGTVVVVEGVYTARPELARYYDLIAYVDTPRETCLRRVRDRGENPPEWIARWRAAEDHYIRTTAPQARANVVVRGD